MKEWDWEANVDLDPHKVATGCNKRAWWICLKCGYKWDSKINNRAILGSGCPCCANKKVVVGKNDLATTYPQLAKEWHKTKNANLKPSDFTFGSSKRIWWICFKNFLWDLTI